MFDNKNQQPNASVVSVSSLTFLNSNRDASEIISPTVFNMPVHTPINDNDEFENIEK